MIREEEEDIWEKAALSAERVKMRHREYERQRKQAQRKRKREDEIASGTRTADGKLRSAKKVGSSPLRAPGADH